MIAHHRLGCALRCGWPPGGASVAVAVSVGVVETGEERGGAGAVQRCCCSTKEKHEMLAVLLGVLAREPGALPVLIVA
jgi:hypothetical protein